MVSPAAAGSCFQQKHSEGPAVQYLPSSKQYTKCTIAGEENAAILKLQTNQSDEKSEYWLFHFSDVWRHKGLCEVPVIRPLKMLFEWIKLFFCGAHFTLLSGGKTHLTVHKFVGTLRMGTSTYFVEQQHQCGRKCTTNGAAVQGLILY